MLNMFSAYTTFFPCLLSCFSYLTLLKVCPHGRKMEKEKYLQPIIDDLQKLIESKSNLQNPSAFNSSELTELAAAINAIADDRARKAKNTFISTMSHEIRTPLNAIMGFAEILEHKINDPELAGYARSVSEGGSTLLRLINDVLDISSIDAGNFTVQKGFCNIVRLVNEMEYLFSNKAKEKGLNFILEIPETFPDYLFIDETRMRQVLLHLIGNAVKFTNSGYVKLKVEINSSHGVGQNTDLLFSVEDSGKGISDERQLSVYEVFNHSGEEEGQSASGSGLGLAMTKRLVEMMKGELTLLTNRDPEKGPVGSKFSVRLFDVETDRKIRIGTGNYAKKEVLNVFKTDDQSVAFDSSELDLAFREIEQDAGLKERMCEIVADLEKDFLPRLKSIRKTFIMGQLSEFAEDILQYNRSKGIKILDLWAGRVISEVKTFDVKHLPETLNCFSRIIRICQ